MTQLVTVVAAPPERCFDLSLSVEPHLESTADTGERAVARPHAFRGEQVPRPFRRLRHGRRYLG